MRIRLLHFALVLLLYATGCHRPGEITEISSGYVPLDYNTTDSGVVKIIAPYKKQHDLQMNDVLGKTAVAMTKTNEKPEHLLGNFVADVVYNAAREANLDPDICLLNNGGLRTSLPQGDITRGKIYELMPFDNEIVVVAISGEKMLDLLTYIVDAGGVPASGLKMGIRGRVPVNILIKGEPFDKTKNYTVATSDYLSGGGDKMSFFRNPLSVKTTGIKIRDAIINHFKKETANGKTITATIDGRIYYETK